MENLRPILLPAGPMRFRGRACSPNRQRSENSRRLNQAAQEGRGPVVEAGRREALSKPNPRSALYQEALGDKGAELSTKPGEAFWGGETDAA